MKWLCGIYIRLDIYNTYGESMDVLIVLSLFIGGWLLIGMLTDFIYKYCAFKFKWVAGQTTNGLVASQVGFTLFGPLGTIVLFIALFIEFLFMFYSRLNK